MQSSDELIGREWLEQIVCALEMPLAVPFGLRRIGEQNHDRDVAKSRVRKDLLTYDERGPMRRKIIQCDQMRPSGFGQGYDLVRIVREKTDKTLLLDNVCE